MPNTLSKIASLTGNSLIFSNIPSSYDDLLVLGSARDLTSGGGAGQTLYMQFNGDGSTLYSSRWFEGNGTSGYSGNNGTNQTGFRAGVINSTGATSALIFGSFSLYVTNYASTSTFKSYVFEYATENNAALAYIGLDGGVYRNTSAITSLSLGTGFPLDTNCQITLYGIKRT